jgi:hypothetical protein
MQGLLLGFIHVLFASIRVAAGCIQITAAWTNFRLLLNCIQVAA